MVGVANCFIDEMGGGVTSDLIGRAAKVVSAFQSSIMRLAACL